MVTPVKRRSPSRHDGAPARRGEAGYNLVMLMVLVTVLNILVAAALPTWTSIEQREREEELIFRGLQYAEGIRVFQSRYGRLPFRLEEMVETEPRSIRQLWPDPMTGEVNWGILYDKGGGVPQRIDSQGTDLVPGGTGLRPGGTGLEPSAGGEVVTQGPILGVYSRADGEAIKTFDGKDRYSEWEFTVNLVNQRLQGGSAPPQPVEGDDGRPTVRGLGPQGQLGGLIRPESGPPDLSSRWVGRPWPPEIQQQLSGGLADGNAPGGLGPGGGSGLGDSGSGDSGQKSNPTVGGDTDPRRR